jgi:uncharacterized damage-inducible protein DinB
MSAPSRLILTPLSGFLSAEAGSFVAQLDDQSRRLSEAIRDITPEELGWQPEPGMNTIGMLLAHLAIVDVFWSGVPGGYDQDQAQKELRITFDDDGMPLPEDAPPPVGLQGKDLTFFDDLLRRARAFLKERIVSLTDADLDREIVRRRDDGSERTVNVRWILYHILEHFAGHFGQILLLRHLYRTQRMMAGTASTALGSST